MARAAEAAEALRCRGSQGSVVSMEPGRGDALRFCQCFGDRAGIGDIAEGTAHARLPRLHLLSCRAAVGGA